MKSVIKSGLLAYITSKPVLINIPTPHPWGKGPSTTCTLTKPGPPLLWKRAFCVAQSVPMLDTSLFRSEDRGLHAVWLVNPEASSAHPSVRSFPRNCPRGLDVELELDGVSSINNYSMRKVQRNTARNRQHMGVHRNTYRFCGKPIGCVAKNRCARKT